MVMFRFKLLTVLILWKNNVADFSAKKEGVTDQGNPSDCEIVENPTNRSRSFEENRFSLKDKENYDILVDIMAMTCDDTVFQGFCNYLLTSDDPDFLK